MTKKETTYGRQVSHPILTIALVRANQWIDVHSTQNSMWQSDKPLFFKVQGVTWPNPHLSNLTIKTDVLMLIPVYGSFAGLSLNHANFTRTCTTDHKGSGSLYEDVFFSGEGRKKHLEINIQNFTWMFQFLKWSVDGTTKGSISNAFGNYIKRKYCSHHPHYSGTTKLLTSMPMGMYKYMYICMFYLWSLSVYSLALRSSVLEKPGNK